jgi:hypothetical protein
VGFRVVSGPMPNRKCDCGCRPREQGRSGGEIAASRAGRVAGVSAARRMAATCSLTCSLTYSLVPRVVPGSGAILGVWSPIIETTSTMS